MRRIISLILIFVCTPFADASESNEEYRRNLATHSVYSLCQETVFNGEFQSFNIRTGEPYAEATVMEFVESSCGVTFQISEDELLTVHHILPNVDEIVKKMLRNWIDTVSEPGNNYYLRPVSTATGRVQLDLYHPNGVHLTSNLGLFEVPWGDWSPARSSYLEVSQLVERWDLEVKYDGVGQPFSLAGYDENLDLALFKLRDRLVRPVYYEIEHNADHAVGEDLQAIRVNKPYFGTTAIFEFKKDMTSEMTNNGPEHVRVVGEHVTRRGDSGSPVFLYDTKGLQLIAITTNLITNKQACDGDPDTTPRCEFYGTTIESIRSFLREHR